jgi:protein SCO1/2
MEEEGCVGMKYKKVYLFLIISILLLSACGQKDIKDAVNWPVKNFTYTDQNNKQFGSKDLKGKIWISDFIYTSCTDICPPMTANLVKLQEMIKQKGLKNVEFVSFSVDPTVDNPQALQAFAKKFGADTKTWTFLTGYSQKTIENFALQNYKALVKKPETGDQVIHGIDFYLVGPDGKIKKEYPGIKDVPFDQIINDIKTLQ